MRIVAVKSYYIILEERGNKELDILKKNISFLVIGDVTSTTWTK